MLQAARSFRDVFTRRDQHAAFTSRNDFSGIEREASCIAKAAGSLTIHFCAGSMRRIFNHKTPASVHALDECRQCGRNKSTKVNDDRTARFLCHT